MLLEGKVCVITGAASRRGIGRATAGAMAKEGARVALLDLDGGAAAEAAAEIGAQHLGLACDVTDRARCLAVAEEILAETGAIDVLFNNAGISEARDIMEVTPEDYDRVMNVNLRGTYNMSQAVIPQMRARGSGSIICMGSVAGLRGGGIFGGPHYAAAKAGVMGFAKAMARQLGPDGIRVNAVAPSYIDTDITAGAITPEIQAEMAQAIPLQRVGQVSDVAGVCLFLASALSSYVTGTVIDINGGMHIH